MSKTGAAFFALQEQDDAETHQHGPSLARFEAPKPSDAAPRRRWMPAALAYVREPLPF